MLDKEGQGIEGASLRVMLSQRSYLEGEDLVREASSEQTRAAIVVDTRTEKDGSFRAEFPARHKAHSVAIVGPFAIGGGAKKDLVLVIAVGENEPTLYCLHCHHQKVKVQQIVKREDGQMEAKKVLPGVVSAELDRSRDRDHLEVVITED